MVGQVLTIIDSLGLKDTQEKATKDLLKQAMYGIYRQDSIYITGEQVSRVVLENKGMSGSEAPRPNR